MIDFILDVDRKTFEIALIILAAMTFISFISLIYIQHILYVHKENQVKMKNLMEEIIFHLKQKE